MPKPPSNTPLRFMRRFSLPGILLAAVLLAPAGPTARAVETYEAGIFTVVLASPNDVLANQTLDVLQQGLAQFSRRLPAGGDPIEVYVAQTVPEFRQLGAPEGRIEGFALSQAGIIVIKAPQILGPRGSYPSILRHELLHVLLARNTGVDHLPRWLNEGIAMMLSRENRWSSMFRVARMYTNQSVIDYDALPFVFAAPGNETVFGDAYAQSLSMTKYLRDLLGEDQFWALIADLKHTSFPEALETRTTLTPRLLYERWYESLWKIAVATSLISGFGLFQLMAVLLVIGFIRKRRRNRRILAEWKEEEDDSVDDMIFSWQLEDQEGPYPWEEDDNR